MTRPRKNCRICFDPRVTYFKPKGVSTEELEEVSLGPDEFEVIRLRCTENSDQHACALKMEIFQSAFQRILGIANQKIAKALAEGKAIKIISNNTL